MNPYWGETKYHNHRAVKAQGSAGLRVDLVDTVQKCGVSHYQGEDNVSSIEGAIK